jgi:3-dehydroquinate synthase
MTLSHAHAVAVGMAVDSLYARAVGHLDAATCRRILDVLRGLDLPLHHPALDQRGPGGQRLVIDGLDEFREHLGGELTILLPIAPGRMIEVDHLDIDHLDACIDTLRAGNDAPATLAAGH